MDIAYTRPRFRTDLVAKPFDEAGQRFVDVTDPDSGKTFRFYEVEYSIACAMDGHRDLAGLVEWAQIELGLEPSPDELKTVISTLDDLGYLEDDDEIVVVPRSAFALGTSSPEDDMEEAMASGDDEFELGNAGKSPLDRSDEERLDAPELTLGMSGNEAVETGQDELRHARNPYDDEMPTTIKKVGNLRDSSPEFGDLRSSPGIEPTAVQPMLRPVGRARTGADEEGPTNIPPPATEFDEEVSVDLTDHMRIGAADVKEAVRQSKVIQAVEPPQELVARLGSRGLTEDDDEDGSATTEHEAPRLAPPPGISPRTEAPPRPPSMPAPAATELPDTPAFLSKPASTAGEDSGRIGTGFGAEHSDAVEPPVEKKSRVGLLLLLLLLVAAGAGAAYYFLIYLPAQEAATVEPQQPVTAVPATPEPPPKPEPPSAKLAAVPVPAVPVAAAREGKIKEILAAGTEVEENAIVVKLAGDEAIQRRVDEHLVDVERYQKRIAENEEKKTAAEAKSPGSGKRYQTEIEVTQGKLTKEEGELAAARAELDAFLLRAPIAGKVVTERAVDQTIAAGDNVFSIELPPRLQATFTIAAGDVPAQGAEVKVAVKGDESKAGTCVVAESKDKDITVACPGDAPFADGTELVLVQE